MSTQLDSTDTSTVTSRGPRSDERIRWLALYVLCVGVMMIVLDQSIVNVALPSIRTDLGFRPSALAWVVNAYLLTFGGFLLLAGRCGDLFGNRRVFLCGTAFFTLASVACGLAPSARLLVVGRAVQGVGGAAVTAVALSLIMGLFPDSADRSKAMGVYGFVVSGGGAVGVLLGGVLTGMLSWHWIFLVNVPIGVAVFVAARAVLRPDHVLADHAHLDVLGALLVTVSVMLGIYAVIGGNAAGWTSPRTLGLLSAGVILLVGFVLREARAPSPLVPLRVVRLRNLAVSQVVGMLWAAAMFAWFFLVSLYLQEVLGFGALEVGLALAPMTMVQMVCSLRFSDRLVMRFGIRPPLVVGLAVAGLALAVFALGSRGGGYLPHVLPSMLLLGLGAGVAFNPVLMVAVGDVDPRESGLASGVVNTAFMLGGALGLAVLVAVSDARRVALLDSGHDPATAFDAGLHTALLVGAVAAFAAAAIGGLFLRPRPLTNADSTSDSDCDAT
jgi:EmrB/QacA subfamily drug resistance transporter